MSIVDTLSMVPLLRLRHGDGVADAAEGVVSTVAAVGGNDEILFAEAVGRPLPRLRM